jgi:formiminotetrahydrofolate cyclodeaminase
MLKDLTITDFINEVDSKKPAPGGGSVSALASSLGIALSRMVGHLTIGRKKYKALDPEIQEKFEQHLQILQEIKVRMMDLIDEDTKAFNLIMQAFSLPKETDQEKAIRKNEIELATIEAIKVPLEVAHLSLTSLEQLDYILQYGNKNALSDLGVSALLLQAGLEGAILNVKINIPGLSNEEMKQDYHQQAQDLLQKGTKLKKVILEIVHSSL